MCWSGTIKWENMHRNTCFKCKYNVKQNFTLSILMREICQILLQFLSYCFNILIII